jgi:hypothetical protein
MKYLKKFNESKSEIEEIKEYLNDLFIEYKNDGVTFSVENYYSENDLKEYLKIEIKSNITNVKDMPWMDQAWECFDLNNCILSLKHLLSYLYSLDFFLLKSTYYKLHGFRPEPYGYILDPHDKTLDSIYKSLDSIKDNSECDSDELPRDKTFLNSLVLNFKSN